MGMLGVALITFDSEYGFFISLTFSNIINNNASTKYQRKSFTSLSRVSSGSTVFIFLSVIYTHVYISKCIYTYIHIHTFVRLCVYAYIYISQKIPRSSTE